MSSHAILSPSGAHRWMACPASVYEERDLPDSESEASREGTLAHAYAASVLSGETPPAVSPEMEKQVGKYIDLVRKLQVEHNAILLVEQWFDLSHLIPECSGTADAVLVADDELIVIDLKYGSNPRNIVLAEGNPQLRLYGLGAYEVCKLLGDFKRVRPIICQPRLDHISEEVLAVEDLQAFGDAASIQGAAALGLRNKAVVPALGSYNPGPKQCQWCKAQATCPAFRQRVKDETACDFDNLDAGPPVADVPTTPQLLSRALQFVPMLEGWCKAVRSAVETALLRGDEIPDFKLVEGKRGARKWSDAEAVEELMKSQFRLKREEMYDFSLISPTTAEKVLSDSPKRWKKLQPLITQSDGAKSVAPMSDKRPAITIPKGDDYAPIRDEELA